MISTAQNEPTPSPSGYIPDIDGLRAIAVLLVVIYHAVPNYAPGGFIGVDVFFVISGFVIARSYLGPLVTREKTLTQFFLARIRRLAPAAFVLVAAVSVAAAILLSPYELIKYAQSAVAQPFYLQNFVFWAEGEYFNQALTKPLLHTWSLAVEEQFYLSWLLLIPILRCRPQWLIPALLMLLLGSILAGYAISGRSPKTVFYLLPFRMWEFVLGILAFQLRAKVPQFCVRNTVTIATVLSIAIVVSGVLFSKDATFPGPQSLIACSATAFLVALFDQSERRSVILLTNAPMAYIGKVSYGFYLWHWPPLALYYLVTDNVAPTEVAISMMGAAFIISAASYHYVETPLRSRNWTPSPARVFGTFVTASTGVVALSGSFLISDGLIQRYDAQLHPYLQAGLQQGGRRCGKAAVAFDPTAEFCALNEAPKSAHNLLLLGDSHADNMKEIATQTGRDTGYSTFLTTRSCDLGAYAAELFCSDEVLDTIAVQIRERNVGHVIAISHFRPEEIDIDVLTENVDRLTKAGVRVSLMIDIPDSPKYDPEKRALQAAENGEPLDTRGMSRAEYFRQSAPVRELFSELKRRRPRITIIDPAEYICDARECFFDRHGTPLYFDPDHLTFTGAALFRPMFERVFSDTKISRRPTGQKLRSYNN